MRSLIFSSLFVLLFGSAYSNNSNIEFLVNDAMKQFYQLTDYNNSNIKSGKGHLNKYIFVYRPGQPFNPFTVNNYDDIFEYPSGITPEGEYLNGVLNNYNNNITDAYNYHHYVIVINLTYAIQSKLKGHAGPDVKTPQWYRSIYDDETIRDKKYYVDKEEALVTLFTQKFRFKQPEFPANHDHVLSFFLVTHEMTNSLNQQIIGGKNVKLINFRNENASQDFIAKWSNWVAFNDNENKTSSSLNVIKKTISNYIKHFYYGNGLVNSSCQDLAATIFHDDSRNYFISKCNPNFFDPAQNQQNKLNALYYSCLYLEYVENVYETAFGSSPTLFDFPGTLAYVNQVLTQYLATNGSEEFSSYLADQFNILQLGIFPLKYNYHKVFYNPSQPSKELLLQGIEMDIHIVEKYHANYNALVGLYPPVELLAYIGTFEFPSFIVEAAWKRLSTYFSYASTGGYSQGELIWLLDEVKEIQNFSSIVMDKWLLGDGGGNFWKQSDQKVGATNLSNFIIRANDAKTANGQSSQFKIINIPYKYDDNFALGSKERNLTADLYYTNLGNFNKFNFSLSLCKEFEFERVDGGYGKSISIKFCKAYDTGNIQNVDFFDQVNLLSLRNHFSYENFCYEGGYSENWHDAKPVAGFYLAYSKDRQFYDDIYSGLQITAQVAGTILTAGEAAVATGVWRIIYGAYTVANIASFYTFNNHEIFEEDVKSWFADEEEGAEFAQSLTQLHTALLFSQIVVTPSNAAALSGKINNYKKAAAFSKMLDDAVDVVPASELAAYTNIDNFGTVSLQIYRAKNADEIEEIYNIYNSIYGIDNTARLAGASGNKLKDIIILSRTGAAKFRNIHTKLNELEDLGKLQSFADDLVANPALTHFFSAASEAQIVRRLKSWEALSLSPTLRTNVNTLEFVEDLILNGVTFVQLGNKYNIFRNSYNFGEILSNEIRIFHNGSYGPIVLNPNKTTLLWGRFLPGGPNDNWGTHYFRWLYCTKVGKNIGGIDILDLPGNVWSWEKNNAWVRAAIIRGDDVKAITTLDEANLVYARNAAGDITSLTISGQELAVMVRLGKAPNLNNGYLQPITGNTTGNALFDEIYNFANSNGFIDNYDQNFLNQLVNGNLVPNRAPLNGQTLFFGY